MTVFHPNEAAREPQPEPVCHRLQPARCSEGLCDLIWLQFQIAPTCAATLIGMPYGHPQAATILRVPIPDHREETDYRLRLVVPVHGCLLDETIWPWVNERHRSEPRPSGSGQDRRGWRLFVQAELAGRGLFEEGRFVLSGFSANARLNRRSRYLQEDALLRGWPRSEMAGPAVPSGSALKGAGRVLSFERYPHFDRLLWECVADLECESA